MWNSTLESYFCLFKKYRLWGRGESTRVWINKVLSGLWCPWLTCSAGVPSPSEDEEGCRCRACWWRQELSAGVKLRHPSAEGVVTTNERLLSCLETRGKLIFIKPATFFLTFHWSYASSSKFFLLLGSPLPPLLWKSCIESPPKWYGWMATSA